MKIDISVNRGVGRFHLHGDKAIEDMEKLAKELRKKFT